MGWIKELNEVSPRVKNLLISISCLIPFWYICIYLFNPFIFFNSTMYLLAPLSFCFSLLWYILSLSFNIISIRFVKHRLKFEDIENEDGLHIIIGGLDSIIYLCIAIFLGYCCKVKYDIVGIHYRFTFFLWLSFMFCAIRAILIGIWLYVFHKLTMSNNSPSI